jgi:hypothetical protein
LGAGMLNSKATRFTGYPGLQLPLPQKFFDC